MAVYRWCGNGCPPSDRLALCKAYIAKAVWDFATTRDLIDAIRHRPAPRRLCGWNGEINSQLHEKHGARHVRVRGPPSLQPAGHRLIEPMLQYGGLSDHFRL